MARPAARDRPGRALPRALLRVHAEGGDRVPALAPRQSRQRHGVRRTCPREPAWRPGADLQRDVGAPEPASPARGADPSCQSARGAARVPRPRSRRVPRFPGSDEGDALPWRGIRVPRARVAPRACRHDCAGSPDEHAEAGGRICATGFRRCSDRAAASRLSAATSRRRFRASASSSSSCSSAASRVPCSSAPSDASRPSG